MNLSERWAYRRHVTCSVSCESHLPFASICPTCPMKIMKHLPILSRKKEHSVFLVVFYAWQMYMLLTEEEKAHDTDEEAPKARVAFG